MNTRPQRDTTTQWARRGLVGGLLVAGAAALSWWLLEPAISLAHSEGGPAWYNGLLPAPEQHSAAEYADRARARLGPLLVSAGFAGLGLAAVSLLYRLEWGRRALNSPAARTIRPLLIVCLLAASIFTLAHRAEGERVGGVYISEVSTSNPGDIADADGDRPDWIEIHNSTASAVDLEAWTLSDDPERLGGWEFPSYLLDPGGRVVVFASGKDRRVPQGELHADFRLDRAGASVLLSEPDLWTVADHLDVPDVPRGASFGRDPGDRRRVCFFAHPSPGRENSPVCHDDTDLGAPRFSHVTGFSDGDIDLTIEHDDPEVTLLYTLDGSYPDIERNTGATLVYDGAIRIADRTAEPAVLAHIDTFQSREHFDLSWVPDPPTITEPIPKATVVRARAEHGAETVATYFVGPDFAHDRLPVISLALDADFLFDHDIGIYVPGRLTEEFLASEAYSRDAHWRHVGSNYFGSGREWQRPALGDHHRSGLFEVCDVDHGCGYQTSVGVRIHGNYTRHDPQKSLRLYADDNPAGPTFAHDVIGGPGGSEHRRILLRASGNDRSWLMFKDGYLQSLMSGFAAETQAYRPAAMYLNGEYWGIHNARERYDQHYLAVTHGADPDTAAIVDHDRQAQRGDPRWADEFRSMMDAIIASDPGSEHFPATVDTHIDVTSFFDFVVSHVYTANQDWPGNNVRAWKQPYGADAIGEGPLDGRWRWMIFDLDHAGEHASLFNVAYDVFTDRMAPTDDPEVQAGYPAMFHRMMENDSLRHDFIRRFSDHLNTAFRPSHAVAELDDLVATLAPEMRRHIDRWGAPSTIDEWFELVERQREFMELRPGVQREQLEQLFGLDPSVELRVSTDPALGHVRLNSVDVADGTPGVDDPSTWTGRYWPEIPVTLEAVPTDGATFERWEGLDPTLATDPIVDILPSDGLEIRAVFSD